MKKILFSLMLAITLVLPVIARADGGIMPQPNYWMRETDQKAVIVFEKNTETLILSTTFEGDAKNFAWIIPTPNVPVVTKAPFNLFQSLEALTNVSQNHYPVYNLGLAPTAIPDKQGVSVIEQKKVDIYDITVLSATDKNSLYNWLKDNKYEYPASGKYILDDYIQNNWIFTTVKIDTESLSVAGQQLRNGTANPLKLVFSSDKIVYPLKISSVTSSPPSNNGVIQPLASAAPIPNTVPPTQIISPDPYISIALYVFADHKKEAIGFNPDWAGWVSSDQINKLAFDENGNPWFDASSKMYLTRLSDSVRASDMKNDVFIVDADNNSSIPPSIFWPVVLYSFVVFLILLIMPSTLLYIIFLLLYIFIKSRIARIIFLILQVLLALAAPLIALVILSGSSYINDLSSEYGFVFGSLALLLAMIIGIVVEILKGRKRQ